MNDQAFERRVATLEALAAANPSGYRLRVLLMALLGNAYLLCMLCLIIGLFAAALASVVHLKAVGIKLALVIGAFLWVVLRALWVKASAPAGREVRREEAPALFDMIDDLRRALRAPRFHHVLLTDDFNAGVAQVPRLGVFGWHRNFLLVGLPLMKALSPEQFKSVLAHEFGHLARGHGAFSNWIYRLRLRWARLIDQLSATQSAGGFLFRPFFNWYAPAFAAYSFPLARANEYEADATAARLTSPEATAQALTNVNLVSAWLGERYWPRIHAQAEDLQQPAFAPLAQMDHDLATDLEDNASRRWLELAMARKTSSADTHPALADRLAALGAPPVAHPPPPGHNAAGLLGAALPALTEEFDQRWKARIMPSWLERWRQVQDNRARLAALDADAAARELPLEDAIERARLTGTTAHAPDAAIAQWRVLADRAPDRADVLFSLGAQLLGADDADGAPLVERAMQLEDGATAPGCEVLRDFHARAGHTEQAAMWHQRLVERLALEQQARQEREIISMRDKFDPHGLPATTVAALVGRLQAVEPALRGAWLVKKRVSYLPDRPRYVFCFTVTRRFALRRLQEVTRATEAISRDVGFPGSTLIFNAEAEHAALGRLLRKVEGSRLI